jgi:uncharacterized protein YbjT (DUF2867 family)
MICPRWVSTPRQPIALDDVVAYLAAVAAREAAFSRSFDGGGPEVMTYRQMIERIARLRGKRRRIVEVPVLTPRLSSWWLRLVTRDAANTPRTPANVTSSTYCLLRRFTGAEACSASSVP